MKPSDRIRFEQFVQEAKDFLQELFDKYDRPRWERAINRAYFKLKESK